MKKIITTALATLVAVYGYSQSYLPLAGGTLSGNLTVSSSNLPVIYNTNTTGANAVWATYPTFSQFGTITNHPILFYTNNEQRLRINGDGTTVLNGALIGTSATFSDKLCLNNPESDIIYQSGGTNNGFLVTPNTYTQFRQGTDKSLNIDTYNNGNYLNVIKVAQNGATTLGGALTGTSATFTGYMMTQSGYGTHGSTGQDWYTRTNNTTGNYEIVDWTSTVPRVNITPSGNIGIGTTSPGAKLHVVGGILLEDDFALRSNGSLGAHLLSRSPLGKITLGSGQTEDWLAFSAGGAEKVRITTNGNVGIGTVTPDSKLTVAGKIHSQEVKVTVDAGADFVFQRDYSLKPLTEVAAYILENKHLPEIASADEMKKNGLELGEMNIKLLQKIEELTLYMIDFHKKMEALQLKNKDLEKEMAALKSDK